MGLHSKVNPFRYKLRKEPGAAIEHLTVAGAAAQAKADYRAERAARKEVFRKLREAASTGDPTAIAAFEAFKRGGQR